MDHRPHRLDGRNITPKRAVAKEVGNLINIDLQRFWSAVIFYSLRVARLF